MITSGRILNKSKTDIIDYCNTLKHQGKFVELEQFLNKKKNLLLLFAPNYFKIYVIFFDAVVHFNRGDFKISIKLFQEFLKKIDNPAHFPTDEAYYYLIRANLHLRNEKNANKYLNFLSERMNKPLFILLSLYYFELYNVGYEVNLNLFFDISGNFEEEEDLVDTQLLRVLALILKKKENTTAKNVESILKIFDSFDNYSNNYYFSLIKMSFLFHNRMYEKIIMSSNYLTISNSCDLINIYCASLYKAKLFDECIICLKKIITCNNSYTYKMNLAKCYIEKKEFVHSLRVLNNIHDRDVDDYKYFLKGICNQKLGNFNDAVHNYKKITTQSKFYDKALLNMAAIYYDNFDYHGCKAILNEIKEPRVINNEIYTLLNSEVVDSPNTKTISIIIFFASGILIALVILIILAYIVYRLLS